MAVPLRPPLRDGTTAAATAPALVRSESAPPAAAARHDCHFCSGVLPPGRALTFCPYCGQNLTVRQCPACSAELDVAWRFCVCCGRGS